jgi:hypothetical protein
MPAAMTADNTTVTLPPTDMTSIVSWTTTNFPHQLDHQSAFTVVPHATESVQTDPQLSTGMSEDA